MPKQLGVTFTKPKNKHGHGRTRKCPIARSSKYVSNIAFLYEIYRENATFPHEFRFTKKKSLVKKKLVNFFKNDKWYVYKYCLYLTKEIDGGHRWKKCYLKRWKYVKLEEVWSKMFF